MAWLVPLLGAGIALAFSARLFGQYLRRRREYYGLWGIAMLMFAAGSTALFLGALDGWSTAEFRAYWLFGAVLNVPYLALGELFLLVRPRWPSWAALVLVLAATAYATAVVRTAPLDAGALRDALPLGRDAFGRGTEGLGVARIFSFTGYFLLLGGALFSAITMRGRPELRNRFTGTLLIALGATVVAGGSAFAAAGNLPGFSSTITLGVAIMFAGSLRAARPAEGSSRSR